MQKAINLYISKKLSYATLLQMIGKAGFDGVIIPYEMIRDYDKEEIDKLLAQNNLQVQMIHCSYNKNDLDAFWDCEGAEGDNLLNDYIKQVEKIKDFAPVDFVIHLVNTPGDRYTRVGENRLKKLVQIAAQNNIRICAENTYSVYNQKMIFENIKSDFFKMCYDLGHEHWLTPDADLSQGLCKKIEQLHLHNNDGVYDWHQPLFEGKMSVEKAAQKIAELKDDIALSLELKFVDDRLSQEFFDEQKASLDKLENMINEYKKR